MVIEALEWGRCSEDQIIHGLAAGKPQRNRYGIKVLRENPPTDSAEEAKILTEKYVLEKSDNCQAN